MEPEYVIFDVEKEKKTILVFYPQGRVMKALHKESYVTEDGKTITPIGAKKGDLNTGKSELLSRWNEKFGKA